ncbi:MAG: dTDP-glucose 4,6-dehydratase [Verrucomicrobiales bacterium]
MKLLITGGSGFIGSALVRNAIALGHSVINVDALTYAGNPDNISGISDHSLYSFERVDIRDGGRLGEVLEMHRPDAIIHLAAQTHVDRSIKYSSEFITTNINGTYALLESVLHYWESRGNDEKFRFLHVSTDEVYGPLDDEGSFTEDSPHRPSSPYSASKAASDHLVNAWHITYGLPVLTTNCSNAYGQYQFPEKLIPKVIINGLGKKTIPIYGNGKNIREWLHINDLVEALMRVLSDGEVGHAYNIGSGQEIANLALVKMICEILDSKFPDRNPHSKLIQFVNDRAGHDFRYSLDSSKISNEIGWDPSIELSEGLMETVNWYLANDNWWKPLCENAQ